ncbi:hypothetical protein LXL04_002325 [Taraxacum kok-saghyz]
MGWVGLLFPDPPTRTRSELPPLDLYVGSGATRSFIQYTVKKKVVIDGVVSIGHMRKFYTTGSISCVTSDSSNPKPNLLVGEGERTRETAARPRERAMYCSSARGRDSSDSCVFRRVLLLLLCSPAIVNLPSSRLQRQQISSWGCKQILGDFFKKCEDLILSLKDLRFLICSSSKKAGNQGIEVADKRIAELEATRDLSKIWLHVDTDAFYAAVETLSNPSLKGRPMAVGSMCMISTANYEARKFGVRAAMPGFIACKLCPDLIFVPTDFKKYTFQEIFVPEVSKLKVGISIPNGTKDDFIFFGFPVIMSTPAQTSTVIPFQSQLVYTVANVYNQFSFNVVVEPA